MSSTLPSSSASSIASSSAPVIARPVVRMPELARDRLRRDRMIAGDHHRLDAGLLAGPDRLLRLGPRRVDHADEAEEGHLALGGLERGVGSTSDRQHAHRVARQLLRRGQERSPGVRVERASRRSADSCACTIRGSPPARPSHTRARSRGVSCSVVKRLVSEVKGISFDAREVGVERALVHPRLCGGHDERALGRVAADLPLPVGFDPARAAHRRRGPPRAGSR